MSQTKDNKLNILIVDHDRESHLMIKDAIHEIHKKTEIKYFFNSDEMLDYLLRRNFYENCLDQLPNIILLNVDHASNSGISALNYLKDNVLLKQIKIFVLCKNLNENNFRDCLEININGIYITAIAKERLRFTVIEIIRRYFILIET